MVYLLRKSIPWHWCRTGKGTLVEHSSGFEIYSKTCVTTTLKKTEYLFSIPIIAKMQVKSIAECSKGGILQYCRPSLSYHLSFRSLFYLLLSASTWIPRSFVLDTSPVFSTSAGIQNGCDSLFVFLSQSTG